MNTLPLYNLEGKEIEKIELKKEIFDGQVNTALMHQAMIMYTANKRQGTSSTKDRSEVSGGGMKPWRQKGTGRARAGSNRSPLWRHGGVTFGPKPRDYSYAMPKKMRLLALRSSINVKLVSNDLILLEDIILKEPKTREVERILSYLKINDKALIITPAKEDSIVVNAAKNIPFILVLNSKQVNADDILRFKKLILTKGALKEIANRLKAVK